MMKCIVTFYEFAKNAIIENKMGWDDLYNLTRKSIMKLEEMKFQVNLFQFILYKFVFY
jgi:hypothetical protein